MPIVGVLAKPIQEEYPFLKIPNASLVVEHTYIYFLEQAGARVIPVDYSLSNDSLRKLMDQTDGILIPGGGSNLTKVNNITNTLEFTELFRAGQFIVNEAIQRYKEKGENYPIWGTCLGHELILMALANDPNFLQSCKNCSSYNAVLYFSDKESSPQSQIYSKNTIIDKLRYSEVPYTMNNHFYMIDSKQLNNYSNVANNLDIITESPSKDYSQNFTSSTEGRYNLPIYTIQYHPEVWNYRYSNPAVHGLIVSDFSQKAALSFVEKCKGRLKSRNNSNTEILNETIFNLKINYTATFGQLFYK